MSDWNITLVEYHSHGEGIQLFPDVFSRSGTDDEDEEAEESAETEEEDGGGSKLPLLFGLVLLVGIAIAVRRYRSDDEEDAYVEPEEVEVTEYED